MRFQVRFLVFGEDEAVLHAKVQERMVGFTSRAYGYDLDASPHTFCLLYTSNGRLDISS